MELIVLTQTFPYGKGETFLETEIEYLCANFSKVTIIPWGIEVGEDTPKRCNNSNFNVLISNKRQSKWGKLVNAAQEMAHIDVLKEIFSIGIKTRCDLHELKYLISYLGKARMLQKTLDEYINKIEENDFVLYSYWMFLSDYVMSRYITGKKYGKNKKSILRKKISRCHRYDLYEEENKYSYLPFRKKILKSLDYICPISSNGKDYLIKRYAYLNIEDKIKVFPLGIENKQSFITPNRGKIFKIVSCSNITGVKRIDKILLALMNIKDYEIEWTHFGDGPLRSELEKLVKSNYSGNLKIILKGHVDNTKIYKEYESRNYNLFINVSESEGIPVSIMEACSFGIPILATNVGGTNEIVKEDYNGKLLKKDFKIEELSDAIREFLCMPIENYEMYSSNAYLTWKKFYNANINYNKFIEFLKNN